MPRVSTMMGRRVYGASGRRLGRASEVLFHPSEPRVVGIQVQPDPHFYIISRRPRFALVADVEAVGEDVLRLSTDRLPAERAGERVLGHSWHDTVVWRGMPVHSEAGEVVGAVHDAVYAHSTHLVTRLVISTGAFGDAALGRLEVEGAYIGGFDGEHVIVKPGYNEIGATGGAAKAAATGAARAKVHGEQLAASALKTSVAAAAMVGRSFRSGAGKKALDKLKSFMDDGE